MGRKRSVLIPPYISYRTFNNFLLEMKTRGLPSRIDRSVMAHKSGTIQSQLLIALDFLGLIKNSGRPTPELKILVEGEEGERKAALARILRSAYPFCFHEDFGIGSATAHQAEELFQRTGASGETLRRCLAFFLAAAREGGVPVSSYIRPHRRKKPSSRLKASKTTHSPSPEIIAETPPPQGSPRVHLRSGGSLKLELSVDLFDLDGEDRAFVFDLVDRIREYQQEPLEETPEKGD